MISGLVSHHVFLKIAPVVQVSSGITSSKHRKADDYKRRYLGRPLPIKIWSTCAAQKSPIWDPLEIFCYTWPNELPGPEMGSSRRALSETRAGRSFARIIKAQKWPRVEAHIEAWYTGFLEVPPASWRSFLKLHQTTRRDQKWASLAELFQNQVFNFFLIQ